MTHQLETSLTGRYAVRHDTPWRRLQWTGPLAILAWLLALWMLSFFITKAPRIQKPARPIDARFIELPEPPAPPLAAIRPEAPSVQRVIKQTASLSTPAPTEAQPSESSTPDLTQASAPPIRNTQAGAAKILPASAPHSAGRPGVAIRAESIGVIERRPNESIYNEETTLDPDGMGLRTGGWHQEYSYVRDGSIEGWEGTFDSTHFSQPTEPWCYNAAPMTPWDPGTCKNDFAKAMAAYKREDYAAAFAGFKKLAEHDYAPAQSNLASMYADGIGIQQDEQQAVFWWRKAGKNGDAKAVYNLALMYSDRKGVAKDDQQAVYWYRKAAYYGYAFAQYNLAVMYALGTGIAKDDKQAAFWYRKAAERGNAAAQYNLGVMYAEGAGVAKDDKQAVYWYCKAADRGDDNAKSSLALLYAGGANKPTDKELTYFCWLLSSVKRAPQNVNAERGIIEKTVTPEQRANAQAAAQIWQPQ